MGCDISIYGYQPDHEKQDACLQFLRTFYLIAAPRRHEARAWMRDFIDLDALAAEEAALPCSLAFREVSEAFDSTGGLEIARHESHVVRHLAEMRDAYDTWLETPRMTAPNDVPVGMALADIGVYYMCVVFDRASPLGTMCSVEFPGITQIPHGGCSQAFFGSSTTDPQSRSPRPDGTLHTWFGASSRHYGEPAPYLLFHVIKRRFVPSLLCHDDYLNFDRFGNRLQEVGFFDKLQDTPNSDLPDLCRRTLFGPRDDATSPGRQ